MNTHSITENQYIDNMIDIFISENIVRRHVPILLEDMSKFILTECIDKSISYFGNDNNLIEKNLWEGELPRQQKLSLYDFTLSNNIQNDIKFNVQLLERGMFKFIKIENFIYKLSEINNLKVYVPFHITNKNFDIYNPLITTYINRLDDNTQNMLYKIYSNLTVNRKISELITNKFNNVITLEYADKYLIT